MSSSDQENKQRNREIAENEAKREMVSNVRVSSWAIAVDGRRRRDRVWHRLGMAQPLSLPILGVMRQSLAGQQIVGRFPARELPPSAQARR